MVLMRCASPSSPSAIIFFGVSATAKSAFVALLTPASVACADSTTATRSVYGLTYSSSPRGSGLAAASRSKTASASAALFFREMFPLMTYLLDAGLRPAKRASDSALALRRRGKQNPDGRGLFRFSRWFGAV